MEYEECICITCPKDAWCHKPCDKFIELYWPKPKNPQLTLWEGKP